MFERDYPVSDVFAEEYLPYPYMPRNGSHDGYGRGTDVYELGKIKDELYELRLSVNALTSAITSIAQKANISINWGSHPELKETPNKEIQGLDI